MIQFKDVALADKIWIDPLLKAADMPGSHNNFTNIYAWSGVYSHLVAQVNNFLVVKIRGDDNELHYFYPVGQGDIKPVLLEMMSDAALQNYEFSLIGLSLASTEELARLFPDKFNYRLNQNNSDYIYTLDNLVTLPGKRFQAKRNHINRFKKDSEWAFELISPTNIMACWDMNQEWCIAHDCADDDMLTKEKCAVTRCFDHFTELGLEGGLLRLSGRVIAYTIGEILNSDTYILHIEKAFSDIHGAYQMINQNFAAYIKERYPHIHYVNREEDMGYEGLRKAKQSYHPEDLGAKYSAKLLAK